MASKDTTTVTYEILTPQDELNAATSVLRTVEQQHYQITLSRMGIQVPAQNDTGATQLSNLASQIDALQTEYERVKALVDAAATPPAS